MIIILNQNTVLCFAGLIFLQSIHYSNENRTRVLSLSNLIKYNVPNCHLLMSFYLFGYGVNVHLIFLFIKHVFVPRYIFFCNLASDKIITQYFQISDKNSYKASIIIFQINSLIELNKLYPHKQENSIRNAVIFYDFQDQILLNDYKHKKLKH